jgi:hypothetical protein
MDPAFSSVFAGIADGCESLVAQAPVSAGRLPAAMPQSGVYLFSEGPRHLFAGRTSDLRGCYARHCSPGATYRMAGFAFRLAREATGRLRPSSQLGSRRGLIDDPEFAAAFLTSKVRIRAMDFRWVEEADPVRQCLLEVYCAVVLRTQYNDFDTR